MKLPATSIVAVLALIVVTSLKAAEKLPDYIVRGEPYRDLMLRLDLESPGLDTATSVVDRDELELTNAFTLTEALEYVPGSWTETRGRKIKQFVSLRGQTYPYPTYTFDGAWQREFEEMPYFIPVDAVERIEVLRSSAGLMSGPGGSLSGVVNVVPRTFAEEETDVRLRYGTYDTSSVQVTHGNTVDQVSYAFGVGNQRTRGKEDMNAAEDMTNFYGRVETPLAHDALRFSWTVFGLHGKRELHLASPPAAGKLRLDQSTYDPYRAILTIARLQYTPTDAWTTDLTLHYANRNHIVRTHYFAGPPAGTSDRIQEKDWETGVTLNQAWKLTDTNTLRASALFNRWEAPDGKRFYAGRRTALDTYSLALVDEQRLGDWVLNAGYRWTRTYIDEYGAYSIEGSSGGGLANVPPVTDLWEDPNHDLSAGAAWQLTETLSLHANVAAGQVEPRPGAVDQATGGLPDTETRYKLDLGARLESPEYGKLSVTVFAVEREDGILLTGTAVDAAGNLVDVYDNRDQRQLGLEVEAEGRRTAWGITPFANVCLLSNRVLDATDEWTTNRSIPALIASGGLRYDNGPWDARLFATYVDDYENTRFLPAGTPPERLGDFTDVSAQLGYRFGPERRHRVYIEVENLMDRRYDTVAGYPVDGRMLYAGLDMRF